jgi:hypothetical protein
VSMATDEGQQAIDRISRRSVLQGGLLVGAGVVAAGAMSVALTGTAEAAFYGQQSCWGFCTQCHTMWWTPDESSSACVAPGYTVHAIGSGQYNYNPWYNYPNLTASSNPQAGWLWCGNCQGMFYGPSTNSVCGSGKDGDLPPHVAGSKTIYDLYKNLGGGTTSNPQPYWRWCSLCALLYYQGPSGSQAGYCPGYVLNNPVSGPHHAGSTTSYDVSWSGAY